MPRTAIVGAAGQLGSALVATLVGDVVPLGHPDLDITDAESVRTGLDRVQPDVVINVSAYNFVDRAEQEPHAAFAVNAIGPHNLSRYCGAQGLTLVHVSTDYVFGADAARRQPYREDDCPGPVSVYGASKLSGEYLVRASCPRSFVVRTCGLYGQPAAGSKGNFVRTMLRLGAEREELRVVSDQQCTPTSTADLAQALSRLVQTEEYGLYHATNSGATTWEEFARTIFAIAGLSTRVVPISSAEYGAAARRPAYSVLDCHRLAQVTGSALRDWRDALADDLRQLADRQTG
jgi:dTDP-4-dehydrorhamnose reductase